MIPTLPPGVRIQPCFVTDDEAETLLAQIGAQPWRSDLRRRVQHYGWRYDYRARQVTPDMALGPLPGWLSALAGQIGAEPEFGAAPDQVIIK